MSPLRATRLAILPLLLATACNRTPFPTYPAGFRQFAYVANTAGNTVTVLDLVFLRPDRTLAVGPAPVALAVNPRLPEVYALSSDPSAPAGSVSVINTDSNTVVASIPVHRSPSAIVVDPSGRMAFVTNTGSNSVSVLDLTTRRPLFAIPAGDRPVSLAIAPDAATLVVANLGSGPASGSVSVYTIAPLLPLAPALRTTPSPPPVPPLVLRATFDGCPGAISPVILPDSSKAFIACSAGHQVLALALAATPSTQSGSWTLKQDPALASDHAVALLDVGLNPTNLTLKPDGGEVFASNSASNSISEIATTTNEVGSTYAIGNRPAHGLVSNDNSALWISNLGEQSISLYSIADGKFLSSVRTGLAPDALAFSDDPDHSEHFLLAADTGSGDVAVIRTNSRLGPALLTILPAGGSPAAIAIKSTPPKP